MADGDSLPQGGSGCSELALTAEGGLTSVAEALREEIMVDVEAVLSQKADSLWKRGQAELGKMQQDRKEVANSIANLQKRQETLIAEQTAMQGALLDITTKMEFVAMEMREALQLVGKVGLDGAPGTLPEPTPSQLLAGLSALGLGTAAPNGLDAGLLLQESAEPGLALQGLCTPPRIAPATVSPTGSCMAPPLPGSPAVLLSLASALPSGPAPSPNTAVPPPGMTRLHIADCLDMSGDAKDFVAHAGSASSVSTSSSPNVNGSSSSSGSPSRVDVASPTSVDVNSIRDGVPEGPCWPAAAPGLSKALGGTMRADAPAFVPGGGFA